MKMDSVVVEKCLAFCQELVESNNKFTFNLSLGKDAFIFENKELVNSSCIKKKSPSQLRREKKRWEERNSKKEDTVKVSENDNPEYPSFKCDHCDATFKSEKGLNIHIGKSHKTHSSSTPEKERGFSPDKELSIILTPVKETREEPNNSDLKEAGRLRIKSDPSEWTPCVQCGKIMPYICHNTCACSLCGACTNHLGGDKCGCSFKKHGYYNT